MLTDTTLNLYDCLDHFCMLIGCNLDVLEKVPCGVEKAIESGAIDIDYERQLNLFLKTFRPELTEIECDACVVNIIQRQQQGQIFRYCVGRKDN